MSTFTEFLVSAVCGWYRTDPYDNKTATFTAFQKLPPELRLYVWEYAIGNEALSRRVGVDDFAFCILPDPRLISPLLTICRESRDVALSYYCDPVPVHAFKLPDYDFRKYSSTHRHHSSLQVAMSFDRRSSTTPPPPAPLYDQYHSERLGRRQGTLRVSLAADTFVDGGRGLSWKVYESGGYRYPNDDPPAPPAETRGCITPVLGDSQYNQVIRTMNDHRIPLKVKNLGTIDGTRTRLAPRQLA